MTAPSARATARHSLASARAAADTSGRRITSMRRSVSAVMPLATTLPQSFCHTAEVKSSLRWMLARLFW